MSIRVLFTTPHLEKVIEPLYDAPKFVRPSLAYLAGYLRKDKNYEVRCVDAKFEQKNLKDLIRIIENFNPDVIGISAFTYEMDEVKSLVEKIRIIFPEKLIVLGGSHITAIPKETLEEFSDIDIGVIGRGEVTIKEICSTFLSSKDYFNIPGIVFRNKKGKVVVNSRDSELLKDFVPAWDLLPPAEEYFIQTTIGCPFNCNFCLNPNGKRVQCRNIDSVLNEIKFLIDSFKPKRISFGDEAFAFDKNFANELLDKMTELDIGSKVNWDIQTHVRFISDNLLCKMKKAKVSKIEVGIESGNEEILKNMGKGVDKKVIREVFLKLKRYRIKSGAFFIFGHPNETKKTVWETIKFAAELNPTEPIFGIMVPFPGTKIWKYAEKGEMGYSNLSKEWGKYRKQLNSSVELSFASQKTIKIYLILANIYVFLYNLRFYDLVRAAYAHRKNIFYFLKHND